MGEHQAAAELSRHGSQSSQPLSTPAESLGPVMRARAMSNSSILVLAVFVSVGFTRDPIIYPTKLVGDKRSCVPFSRGKVCRPLCTNRLQVLFCFYARAFCLIILFRPILLLFLTIELDSTKSEIDARTTNIFVPPLRT